MAGVVRTIPSHSSRSTPRVVKAPRPPNAWIIYRSDKAHQLPPLEPGQPRRAQAEVSKMISNMWANESEQTRQEYERRAEEAKAAHALKYPGYRFKPMKKEEKRAQREQEQNERLAKRREHRKTDSPNTLSLSPTPPPTASLPNYYASIHMPINLPQFAHGLPPLLPYPFMPYYAPQTRFGPAGPTPPVSAAGSPSDPSPSPDNSNAADEPQNIDQVLTMNDRSNGRTSEASSSGVPASKDSRTFDHTLFPSFNTSTFASGQEWPHAPTNAGTLTPALTPSPLWPDADSNQLQETSTSNHVVPADNVSFDFEPYQLSNLDNLLSGSTEDTLSAFINATADPGVFRMTNLDSSQLLANPTGEIEVSLGEFPPLDLGLFPSELFNFHDPFATAPLPDVGNAVGQELFMHPSQPTTDEVPQAVSGSGGNSHDPSSLPNANYNPDDYLDFGPSSTLAEFQNGASATTVEVVASTGGYVPPAGATNSSLRRVGGTWSKPFLRAQTPSPPRITGVTQSQ